MHTHCHLRNHRTLFVIDKSVLQLDSVDTLSGSGPIHIPITRRAKKQRTTNTALSPAVTVHKNIRAHVIEAILEYCRILWDIRPADYGDSDENDENDDRTGNHIALAIWNGAESEYFRGNLDVLNSWRREEQSFTHIVDKLSTYQLSEKSNVTSTTVTATFVDAVMDRLLDGLVQHHESKQPLLRKQQRLQLFYFYHPTQVHGTESSVDCLEVKRFVQEDIAGQLVQQWKHCKSASQLNRNLKIGMELIVPVTDQWCDNVELLLRDKHVISSVPAVVTESANENLKMQHAYASTTIFALEEAASCVSVDMRAEIWFSSVAALLKLMTQRVCQVNGLSKVNVLDIPMLSANKKDISHDVELICEGFTVDIVRDLSYSRRQVNLRWKKIDRGLNIEQHCMTRSMHRITPVHINMQATMCLMKHLANGKPVGLCVEGEDDIFTHLLLPHGSDVWLHVLDYSVQYRPLLHFSNTVRTHYRHEDFEKLMRIHTMYFMSPEQSLMTPTTLDDISTISSDAKNEDNMMQPSAEDSISTLSHLTTTSSGTSSLVEHNLSFMRHNRFIYPTPTSIERHTRLFPLVKDPMSVLYMGSMSEALSLEICPLLNLLMKEHLEDFEEQRAKGILTSLRRYISRNDPKLFPELEENHSARHQSYHALWSEVRILVITMEHTPLLETMDRLWPQFFFDRRGSGSGSASLGAPSTSGTVGASADSVRRQKKVLEVQRDRHGNVVFPLQLGGITIHSLGKVIWDRPAYHTEKYIWPVGFKSSRLYSSIENVDQKVRYYSEIRDGGDAPLFVLTCEESPDKPIVTNTATAAWTVVVKRINEIKTEEQKKRVFTNVSGPEYFGLAHPTVMKLVSELPNAEKVYRPANPFQPESLKSSSALASSDGGDDGDGGDDDDDEQLNDMSDDDILIKQEAAHVKDARSPTSTQSRTMYGQSTDPILMARKQRDEYFHESKQKVLNQVSNSVRWTDSKSLFDFVTQRHSKVVEQTRDFDGRKSSKDSMHADLYVGLDTGQYVSGTHRRPQPQEQLQQPYPQQQQQQQHQQFRYHDGHSGAGVRRRSRSGHDQISRNAKKLKRT